MHSLTLRHLLPGVRTPTLVTWGREDESVPLNSGEIYAQAIPRARLVAIPNCGHMPEMKTGRTSAELVRNFLACVSRYAAAMLTTLPNTARPPGSDLYLRALPCRRPVRPVPTTSPEWRQGQ